MNDLSHDASRTRWARRVVLVVALSVLLLAGCGDDDEGAVDTTATTAPTTTSDADGAIEPGLEEFTAMCRDGDVSGCRQLSDATLQDICVEGQAVACQIQGSRVGEGDPEGDGTVPFEEGCRAGEFESCVQLSDATLQEICDEGQTAACQVYLSRTGDG